MKKYIGTFVIPVENVYRFEIEADSEEKALELLKQDPLLYASAVPVDSDECDAREFRIERCE
ncbi:hypothetical protein H3S74_12270 [Gilliamella sp. W8126]|uniref:hypothetical protein n=1 Tax=Gilliamella sp. W8126 TaxID=2750946 RepID=UPI0018DC67B3|nr:hypothetical protein [Gilliamella sp. W8126]MBI0007005.1 hypothetical protein [Gilliamella sp. W8126]